MSDQKLCKDCKHSKVPFLHWLLFGRKYQRCTSPKLERGLRRPDGTLYSYCRIERDGRYKLLELCGPEAKHWEPRK